MYRINSGYVFPLKYPQNNKTRPLEDTTVIPTRLRISLLKDSYIIQNLDTTPGEWTTVVQVPEEGPRVNPATVASSTTILRVN